MPLDQPINAVNDTPDKTHEITANCDLLWSQAQQFAYLRLSDKTGDNEYELIGLYAARARRIAATYARFYLETEDGGDTDKIGRYYWMALAAFASKTVSCILDSFQVKSSYRIGHISGGATDMKAIANGLGQGNLWLFNDIAPTHWLYSHYPHHFFSGMACLGKRDANQLEERVKETLNDLPWASKSLPRIKHFKPPADGSPSHIYDGFLHVLQIENTEDSTDRSDFQLKQVLKIAEHEQKTILQELIYNDPVFAKWLQVQRNWRWAAPTYQLLFTHLCSESNPELKSVAPNDMVLENYKSRMDWINDAARMFHDLMNTKEAHMLNELRIIATWVDSPDAESVY